MLPAAPTIAPRLIGLLVPPALFAALLDAGLGPGAERAFATDLAWLAAFALLQGAAWGMVARRAVPVRALARTVAPVVVPFLAVLALALLLDAAPLTLLGPGGTGLVEWLLSGLLKGAVAIVLFIVGGPLAVLAVALGAFIPGAWLGAWLGTRLGARLGTWPSTASMRLAPARPAAPAFA